MHRTDRPGWRPDSPSRAWSSRHVRPAAVEPGASAGASAAASNGGGDKGTVKIAINPWVGAEANVAVVKRLLEDKLGYTVEATEIAEEVAWPGFETGESDAILENWGHPDLEKLYIADKKVAQDAGPNGVTGIIGWYVPHWMVERVPRHPRLGQPQQVRRPVQDLRVGRQGPVPRPATRPS